MAGKIAAARGEGEICSFGQVCYCQAYGIELDAWATGPIPRELAAYQNLIRSSRAAPRAAVDCPDVDLPRAVSNSRFEQLRDVGCRVRIPTLGHENACPPP